MTRWTISGPSLSQNTHKSRNQRLDVVRAEVVGRTGHRLSPDEIEGVDPSSQAKRSAEQGPSEVAASLCI